ncbi:MAG TPA: tetratricopeptide repeat protein [Myxococcales bacterium]|nr:tetratricopeptide repeat protein [Myxococcales bacterium]
MAQKLDRKQLKKPDEFQVVAGKAMEWIVAHQKVLLISLATVVVLIAVAWGAFSWSSSREAKAGGELAAALELQSRPLASEGPPQAGSPTFASKEERTKASLAALEKVRSDFPRSTAAQTAVAQVGFLKLKEGDAAGAVAALQQFLKDAGRDHPLRPIARESLGYAFEAQGKLEEARSAFAELAQDGAPARGAFQQARIALVEGKPDARQQLEQVAKDYAKEPVAQEANMRVELAALPPPGAGAQPPPQPAKKPPATATKGKK